MRVLKRQEIVLRPAVADDAAAIVALRNQIWPGETSTPSHVASIIAADGHSLIVAQVGRHLAGFASGFVTFGSNDQRRWEVDLLAVHPRFRRMGLASRLIERLMVEGRRHRPRLARGLIGVENVGSQRTFARHGFKRRRPILELMISTIARPAPCSQESSSHLVAVRTVNYDGIWVEGRLSAITLASAQAQLVTAAAGIVGTLIPVRDTKMLVLAHQLGYEPVGRYEWWVLELEAARQRADRLSDKKAV